MPVELLASPTMTDPNFARSVILIAEHTEEGAMGLVLNRPAMTTVGEAVPDLAWLATAGLKDITEPVHDNEGEGDDSPNGAIRGSVVGTISGDGSVHRLRTIDPQWKVEGVHATIDTGVTVEGPAIGVNTTGQSAEGPFCV